MNHALALSLALLSFGCASHNQTSVKDPGCAPSDAVAHSHEEGTAHTHSHEPAGAALSEQQTAHGVVIPHEGLASFGNNGNSLVGLATRSQGARSFEVWRSVVAPGGSTPRHVHDTEEVFVLLRGKGEMIVGDQVIQFEAPATVIAPAHVPHQLKNTGDVPTDQIVIVGVDSTIRDDAGQVMQLPWRK